MFRNLSTKRAILNLRTHYIPKEYLICKQKYNLKATPPSPPIANAYVPQAIEDKKLSQWILEEQKLTDPGRIEKPKFIMILPPPNITGNLHLGHALMCTIQDVIARKKRQLGFEVIWVPGTDHAGIATQVVVEKKIAKEQGITRQELGRERLLQEIQKWKNEKENHIFQNLKKMGCTLNWNLKYFTMDQRQERAVNEAFIRLFEEGLITRENSLVNWSCTLESAISDIEVEMKEIKEPTLIPIPGYDKNVTFGQLYDIAYKIMGEDEEIVISTTRPETILGDVAVAVHPADERYKKFQNKSIQLWHPFRKEPIPLIFDEAVDKEFGTGALKITPAHDKNDFEVAKKHQLDIVQVFTNQGKICENFSKFHNEHRFDARIELLNDLATMNLLRGIKPHAMNVPICSRSNDVVEYMLREQWFLKCQKMAENAMKAVETGKIKIHPQNFETNWYRWMSACRDWCISRQLWWGHQIPAYLCKTENESIWVAAKSKTQALIKAKHQLHVPEDKIEINRDPDILDTWFSSSLLPFSVFGWPDQSYLTTYPLDLMETGHDILFFWVARMVMLGQKLTGDVPFRNVLLNGIVCDAHGRKMSKSLGNIIYPEQIIHGVSFQELKNEISKSYDLGVLSKKELEKSLKGVEKNFPNGIPECGIDSLRFTLCSHNIKNHFINFDVPECYTNRTFFNKIWQATRYTLSAFDKLSLNPKNAMLDDNVQLGIMDKWILSRLANTRKFCNQNFEQYNFHHITGSLKTFFYSNFCDVYLEVTKPNIKNCSEEGRVHCSVLAACLSLGLQTMSPVTPFLSDELLQYFPEFSNVIESNFIDNDLEAEVNEILNICMSVRQLKSQNQITRKHEPKLHLFPQTDDAWNLLCKYRDTIKILTMCNEIFLEKCAATSKLKDKFELISVASHISSFAITTNEKLERSTKIRVLNKKKLEKLQNDLQRLMTTISNEGYKSSANENVQKKHLDKIKQLETEISSIKTISEA